jgi:PAS domain S-box-containing protein
MQLLAEPAPDEADFLRRCVDDLMGLFALPSSISAGPQHIARRLVDTLVEMLHVDLVYVRFNATDHTEAVDWPALEPGQALTDQPRISAAALRLALGEDPGAWPRRARRRVADTDLSVVTLPLGAQGSTGVLVAASARASFAQDTEALLLKVAATQAAMALQSARLLDEHARLAATLDARVAQRTSDLHRANLALLREISQRRRAEEALTASERSTRSVIDGLPGFVATLSPNGTVESINRGIVEYTGQSLETLKDWDIQGTVHPDDLPHVTEVFTGSIAAGVPYLIEQRLRRYDGAYRWFENRGVPVRDVSGSVVHWNVLLTDIDERRLAQEELRKRELVSREMVDEIPILISLLSPTGELQLINRQTSDYTGRTMAELTKAGVLDPVHPDDFAHVRATFGDGLRAGQPFDIVYRLRRFDGVYRWFEGRHRPLKDVDGCVVRWCVSVNDIDDRKRAEEALAASERNLKLSIDTTPALMWSTGPDGTADSVNQHYVDYVGRPAEQLLGLGWTAAVHPEDMAGLATTWQSILASGQGGSAEARFRRHDGEYRWLLLRVNPLRDEDGSIVRWYGINTDIEDRNRAEEERRRSEAFLAEAQRLSSTGSFSWRLESDDITFSDELYRIFEFETHTPPTLERIGARIHPEDIPLLTEKLRLARVGVNDHDYDIRLQMPDGRIRYLRTVARAIPHPCGGLEYLGMIQDVTERRHAEDALAHVRSELAHVTRTMSLGVLTASIAHEVNQPLSGIITNAGTCLRLLAAQPPNINGALETARRTIRDGKRAADVIARLHALFKKKAVVTEPVDLNEATREVLALSAPDLQRRCVTLHTELDEQLPLVNGDRVQLQQVILNLLLNAADAMKSVEDRPRRIVIQTTRDQNGAARLSVRDSGVGVMEESLNRVFDAFYTTKPEGMGIGLSVSRSIIVSHEGRLWCEPHDGPGVTFAFSIPAKATEA